MTEYINIRPAPMSDAHIKRLYEAMTPEGKRTFLEGFDEADHARVSAIINPNPVSIQEKIDMVHNLQFFANAKRQCLWCVAQYENGTEQEKADIAESIRTLEALKADGFITMRRTCADNLSIKMIGNSIEYLAELRERKSKEEKSC